jgi:hypothetical protein
MKQEEKDEIVKMGKQFAKGFKSMIPSINGSGWLIVDPLSGYLNACGYENKLHELPETDKHAQVLVMTFKDGSQLIPAGADLKPVVPESHNWIWI